MTPHVCNVHARTSLHAYMCTSCATMLPEHVLKPSGELTSSKYGRLERVGRLTASRLWFRYNSGSAGLGKCDDTLEIEPRLLVPAK